MNPLQKTARISGLLYLALAIFGAYGILYVPSQLLVPDDAARTAENILGNLFLFRTGIAANLVSQTAFLFLALMLYKLFEQTDKHLSRILLALVISSVSISFMVTFNQLNALTLLTDPELQLQAPDALHVQMMSSLKMFESGNSATSIFWGLWLIPFGMLACKSSYMPRILGLLLILGGLSYVVDALTFLLLPDLRQISNAMVSVLASIAELATVFWLLIKGIRIPTGAATA